MQPVLLEAMDVESSNDPFSRWLSRAPELTRRLGVRVRLSLEPAILSRGFSRTLFTRGHRDLKTLPFEIVFERYVDSVCQNIGVRFEKRFRPLSSIHC